MADACIVPWKILQEPRTTELIRKFLSDDLMPEEFTHQFLQIAQMSELEDQ
jgi:hypothetical protein